MNHIDFVVVGYLRFDFRCWFKCKEGFYFKEYVGSIGFEVFEDVLDGRFEMKCVQDWDRRIDWQVFIWAWDRYGDCDGDYGNDCDMYFQCVPDDFDYEEYYNN